MRTGPLSLESAPSARLLLLLLAAVPGCSGPAAPVVETGLRPTADTLVVPYGDISGAAWVTGRRWLVIAPQDRAVSVADFDRHTLSRFGAAELGQPYHLFRSGDSIMVADWLRRRLTVWSRDGALRGALPAAAGLRGALPRARDAAGRWYFELPPVAGPDGRGNLDSTAIVRTAADGGTVIDTVGHLTPSDLVEVMSEGRRRLERRLLSGQDRWGVLPDGALWIARTVENRVDWRGPDGRRVQGRPLPDRVLPITQNDRDIFLGRFDAALRPTVEQTPFAVIKPPFEDAVTAPEGAVWLIKNRAVGDTIRDYQIVDREGRMVGSAHHPGLGRLLALGDGYALVSEPFAGGIRLLLFQLVAPPGA